MPTSTTGKTYTQPWHARLWFVISCLLGFNIARPAFHSYAHQEFATANRLKHSRGDTPAAHAVVLECVIPVGSYYRQVRTER